MKSQPNRNYTSSDEVQTPDELALAIVRHFKIEGIIMEPCAGDGAFLRAFEKAGGIQWLSCEIKEGTDFLADTRTGYSTICTNPPWSKFRAFLQRSMASETHNIIFLVTVNHAWTKARVRDVHEAGFGLKEILLCEMPKSFPQSGFQLGAVHWQRGWSGDVKLSRL